MGVACATIARRGGSVEGPCALGAATGDRAHPMVDLRRKTGARLTEGVFLTPRPGECESADRIAARFGSHIRARQNFRYRGCARAKESGGASRFSASRLSGAGGCV